MAEPIVKIVAEKEGFYRETTSREFLGGQEHFLAQAASSIPLNIHNLYQIDNKVPYRVHLQSKASQLLVFTRLPFIKLDTWFRYTGEKKERCYPCFNKENATDFQAAFHWTPTKFDPQVGLWFIMLLSPPRHPRDYGAGAVQTHTFGPAAKFFLLMVKVNTGGFYKLPLCNIYTDGAICMGEFQDDATGLVPLTDRFSRSLLHFYNSPWNTHLMEYVKDQNNAKLFQFEHTGECLPLPEKWEKFCDKVNSTIYTDLQLHVLTALGL